MTDAPDRSPHRLVDFPALVRRLFWVAVVLGGVAVAGAVLQGLLRGLTFGVLLLWGTLWVVGMVVAGAVTAALHAVGGAGRARRRGERLASRDVGAMPTLPSRPPPRDGRGDRRRDPDD